MADIKIDDTVDITDVVCPVTFVKAKVALEELDDGQILAIKMNDGEPVQNVNFDSELASEYEVQAAPTLVFFKNGEEKERLRGAVKKSEIIEVTEKLIKE